MLSLDQGEELNPMASLKRLLVQLFREVDDNGGFFDLLFDLSSERLAHLMNIVVGRQLDFEVGHDLID